MKENNIEVVTSPTFIVFKTEGAWGEEIVGSYPGTHVGVKLGGQEVWERDIYPFFISLREVSMYIPKPFYGQRIASARKKAESIAQRLQEN